MSDLFLVKPSWLRRLLPHNFLFYGWVTDASILGSTIGPQWRQPPDKPHKKSIKMNTAKVCSVQRIRLPLHWKSFKIREVYQWFIASLFLWTSNLITSNKIHHWNHSKINKIHHWSVIPSSGFSFASFNFPLNPISHNSALCPQSIMLTTSYKVFPSLPLFRVP